jgi:hypothetical protein
MTSTEKQPLSKKRKLEKLSSSSSSKSGKSSAAGDTVAAVKKGPSFEQDLKKLAGLFCWRLTTMLMLCSSVLFVPYGC